MIQNVHIIAKSNRRVLSNGANSNDQYKKHNNKRTFVRVLFFAAVILTLLSVSGLASAFIGNQDAYAASNHAAVQPFLFVEDGDTLWSIASEHAAKGQDVREYVYKLKQLNGLKSSTLHAGQKLFLPVSR